jgi:hypothetical protein
MNLFLLTLALLSFETEAFASSASHHQKNLRTSLSFFMSMSNDITQDMEHLFDTYNASPAKDILEITTPLQELASNYDRSDATGKSAIIKNLDEQMKDLAERMAILKSVSDHLQKGDDYLLEDEELSTMKNELWTTASSLKCGKQVDFLYGNAVKGLQGEIMSAMKDEKELQDEFLSEMKEKDTNSRTKYEAWIAF